MSAPPTSIPFFVRSPRCRSSSAIAPLTPPTPSTSVASLPSQLTYHPSPPARSRTPSRLSHATKRRQKHLTPLLASVALLLLCSLFSVALHAHLFTHRVAQAHAAFRPARRPHASPKGRRAAPATQPFRPPLPRDAPPHCSFLTKRPDATEPAQPDAGWRFNSRAFCVTSAVCIRPSTPDAMPVLYRTSARGDAPTCALLRADLTPGTMRVDAGSCARMARALVTCAHGRYAGMLRPACPTVRPMAALSAADNASATVLGDDEVAVVVPAYPFQGNIFHAAFAIGFATQLVEALPRILSDARNRAASAEPGGDGPGMRPRNVVLLFRGPTPVQLGAWQHALMQAQLRRLSGVNVRIATLGEVANGGKRDTHAANRRPVVCARTAVLLGQRGNVNLWPFANTSAVPTDGSAASAQSIFLRRAMYDMHGMQTHLPARLGNPGTVFRVELPALSLAYARRDAQKDPPAGKYIVGTARRFNDSDDAWFVSMLREEAFTHNASFTELRGVGGASVRAQVRAFGRHGVVAGIHGANLANVLFARAFGALVEILPRHARLPCYEAGSNAGLAYWAVVGDGATAAESRCSPQKLNCQNWPRERLVKIGRAQVRAEIRRKVGEALAYVQRLRRRYPGGIPVRYVAGEDRYVVVGSDDIVVGSDDMHG